MKKSNKTLILSSITLFLMIISVCTANMNMEANTVQTSGELGLSNSKIEWGIKRAENNMQPDLGSKNRKLIEKYNGMAMGNAENKYIYVTFDLGYEAGYTENILNILKENNVPATFFVTAHYINTASGLVQKMINDGHIIGNHTPKFLMSGNGIQVRC